MPKGKHVSYDCVQVDMFFFDLSNAVASAWELLETIEQLTALDKPLAEIICRIKLYVWTSEREQGRGADTDS